MKKWNFKAGIGTETEKTCSGIDFSRNVVNRNFYWNLYFLIREPEQESEY